MAGPSGSTSHTAFAIDPVYGSQWRASSIDTTLTVKQDATLTGSYGFTSTGEVSPGTAPSALTGQRGQPTEAFFTVNKFKFIQNSFFGEYCPLLVSIFIK